MLILSIRTKKTRVELFQMFNVKIFKYYKVIFIYSIFINKYLILVFFLIYYIKKYDKYIKIFEHINLKIYINIVNMIKFL